MSIRVAVSNDGAIYIPPAIRERAGIKQIVQVIESKQGLLLMPIREESSLSWEQFFAQGLIIQRPAPLDLSEMCFDELWL